MSNTITAADRRVAASSEPGTKHGWVLAIISFGRQSFDRR